MNKQEFFALNLDRVITWIKENPNTDPNAYEMCSIYLEATEFHDCFTDEVRQNLEYMHNKRINDFKDRLNIGLGHPLVDLIVKLYNNAKDGIVISKAPFAKEAICKIAGISLYIVQEQKKSTSFCYSNYYEFAELSNKVDYCKAQNIELPKECTVMFQKIERQILKNE